jgi:hypothetical protein
MDLDIWVEEARKGNWWERAAQFAFVHVMPLEAPAPLLLRSAPTIRYRHHAGSACCASRVLMPEKVRWPHNL